MSNVEGFTRYEKITGWRVPLKDGKCTARDISDLQRVAEKSCAELTPGKASYDDAYWFEWDEDYVRVVFRTEVKQGAVLEL